MHLCPKTHYDILQATRPDWLGIIQEAAKPLPALKTAYVGDDFDYETAVDFIQNEMLQRAKEHLRRNKLPSSGLTVASLSEMHPDYVKSVLMSSQLDLSFVGNYEIHGKRTFFFSPNLSRKLAETELNVSSELLTLPFPSCMFVYDCQVVRDSLYLAIGQEAPSDGTVSVYMVRYKTAAGTDAIASYAHLTRKTGEAGAAFKRELALEAGTKIEDVLRTDWSKVDGGTNHNELLLPDAGGDAMFNGPGIGIMRIIANSALYLASSNPDIIDGLRESPVRGLTTPSKKERRRYERQVTSSPYIVVGSHISDYSGPKAEGDGKLDHRLKVRGHWKSQAHGKGLSERKHIFVEPYWKGPEAAEVLTRDFVVRS